MKPNRTITVNCADMSLDQINALIKELQSLREDKLTKIADEYTEKLNTLVCEIMDDGFVVYCNGQQIEPIELDVRID